MSSCLCTLERTFSAITDVDREDALSPRSGSGALELVSLALEQLLLGLAPETAVVVLDGLVVDEVVLRLAARDVAVVELAVGRDAPGGGIAVGVPLKCSSLS